MRFQFISKATDECCEILHLLRIGQVMNTVDERLCFFPFSWLADEFRDRTIGEQHKFLYQFIGFFRFLEIDLKRLAVLVDLELHFIAVKIDRSILEAFFP